MVIPSLRWLRQLGSKANDTATDLCADASDAMYATGRLGGAIELAGASLVPEATGDTRFFLKLDAEGALVWAMRVAGPTFTVNQMIGARGGGVLVVATVAGETRVLDAPRGPAFVAPASTGAGLFVMRVAGDGEVRWARRFDGDAGRPITGKSIAEVDGGVVVTGVFGGGLALDSVTLTSAADDDVYVARLDPDSGAVLSAARAATPADDAFPQLVARGDGLLLAMTCGGVFEGTSPPVTCDGLGMIEYDASLGVRGARSFAVEQAAQVLVAAQGSGHVYLAARFSGAAELAPLAPLPAGPNRTLVARLDPSLAPLTARLLPNPGASAAGALAVDGDGGLLLGGWVRGCLSTASGFVGCTSPASSQNGVTIKLTASLDVAWFGMQQASEASVNGVVTSLALSPTGALLGAANFSDKVTVGSSFVSSAGGVDGVVGRFELVVLSVLLARAERVEGVDLRGGRGSGRRARRRRREVHSRWSNAGGATRGRGRARGRLGGGLAGRRGGIGGRRTGRALGPSGGGGRRRDRRGGGVLGTRGRPDAPSDDRERRGGREREREPAGWARSGARGDGRSRLGQIGRGRGRHRRGGDRGSSGRRILLERLDPRREDGPDRAGQRLTTLGVRGEARGERRDVGRAQRGIAREARADRVEQLGRQIRATRGEIDGRIRHDPRQQTGRREALERERAAQELVQHDPERPDVRAGVDVARIPDLLGGHVRGRAEQGVRPRQRIERVVGELRDAEIDHARAPSSVGQRGQEEVRRLQIAVHDPARVRLRDPVRGLEQVADGLVGRERPAGAELVGERHAVDVLEHDGEPRVGELEDVEHAHDVIAPQPRGGAGLPEQPRVTGLAPGREHLDRDALSEQRVARGHDDAHAPLAEDPLDDVLLRDGVALCEQGRDRGAVRARCRTARRRGLTTARGRAVIVA